MIERSPLAALATRSHPRALKGFALSALPIGSGGAADITVEFQLNCLGCGGSTFRIYSFPLVVPDPSPYAGLDPGETLFRPPHSAECVQCGTRASVFDARTDGYDGVLNGGGPYESGGDREASFPGEFTVVVWLTYNVDAEDLDDLYQTAREAGVEPADLFDWMGIQGTATDGSAPFSVDYECA
jgi:hypothetical protein